MRKLLSFLILAFSAINLYAQTEPATYKSTVAQFRVFYNNNKPDSIYKMFGPDMSQHLTQADFKTTTGQLKTQLGALVQTNFTGLAGPVASYDAKFENGALTLKLALDATGKIAGLLLQPVLAKQIESAIPDDPSLIETQVTQKILSGNISGTLTMPKNANGKIPVVLIIAGSGPTDRDGNSPKLGLVTNTYKLLAMALGKAGIASLRYDKRLVGKSISTTKEKDMHFDDYVDDAIALVNMLHDDQRFSKIIILGHSEGSLVGMMAAYDQPVNAFISVAGAGQTADKVISDQLKGQPEFVTKGFTRIVDSLKKGKFTDQVAPDLYALAGPNVQPYLLSWMYRDPAREIHKLKIPVLILQGSTDLQVGVADAEKLKKGKSDAVLTIIPNMNHTMKEAPVDREKNLATYKDPNLPLKPELVSAITGFIEKVK